MRILIMVLMLSIITSCNKKGSTQSPSQVVTLPTAEGSESFQVVDVEAINQRLKQLNHILNPQEVAQFYYPQEVIDNAEGSETIRISTDGSKIETTEVTLIHDNLVDDLLMSIKHVIVMRPVGDKWEIVSAHQNWRCWKNGPDGPWGTEPC